MKDHVNEELPLRNPQGTDGQMLSRLQRETFAYFLKQMNPVTGLIADKSQPGAPASIGVVGMGLTAYIIGVEKHFLSRTEAAARVHKILGFFYYSHQGEGADASGYKGFYYHFLDHGMGRRVWECELSTIDTALLMAGVLAVAAYFSRTWLKERQIREWADAL